MNYCSLEEAWGVNTSASKGCDVHVQHKKKFEKDNPIHTPNINYECSFNEEPAKNKETLTGYTGKALTNYQPSNYQVSNSKNYNLLNRKNEDLDLYSFIKSLNIDEATKEILKNKISNAIDSVKYESIGSNRDIREDFSSRYFKPNGLENRNVDILFLILLGLFIIFILDKK